MTIPEAVSLVIQAGTMSKGGEVFILDMGNPVKIVDLASEMIKLSGYEPFKDIDIIFTGIRPGEKLHEELFTEQEGASATCHKKIFVASPCTVDESELESGLKLLESLLYQENKDSIFQILKKITSNLKRNDIVIEDEGMERIVS